MLSPCSEPQGALLGDVEQREEEDPDDIDKMPVDPDQFHAMKFRARRTSNETMAMISSPAITCTACIPVAV